MQRTRVASVSYLNALPLTWGLSHGRHRGLYDLVFAPPHECSRLLQEGLVDIALIPSVDFARIPGLTSVPGTGISSRNEVRSVLLISRGDAASIVSLAADFNSRTSVALASLILAHRYGCRPRVEPMPPDLGRMLEKHDAALLIGDAALKASLREELRAGGVGEPRALDLAREWNEMTGLPFVFAFWACRPVVRVSEVREVLLRSLEEGLAHIDAIAERESERTSLPADVIAVYLRHNIRYRMGPAESDSLRVFYRMCREEGILPGGGVRPAGFRPPRSDRLRGTAGGTGTPSTPRPLPPRGR